MKRLLAALVFSAVLATFATPVHAASAQVYNDFLYQFELFRTKFSEYSVALNEYKQFHSLASEQTALERARTVLGQRDQAYRMYVIFLQEKLNENPGMLTSEKQLYSTILTNENSFLVSHSTLIPSLGSLSDIIEKDTAFKTHDPTLQAAMRQSIIAIQLGYLSYFAKQFDTIFAKCQTVVSATKPTLPATKQSILDRWLLSITNKRSLYQQKVDAIRTSAFKLGGDITEQDRTFLTLEQSITDARQYLVEGVSFMGELMNALRYEE